MENKQFAACGQSFQPRPQVPDQTYCSAPDCQCERRKQWQRRKLQTDPDYQDNQARAQQAWTQRNPGYWREYRESHLEYVERNRVRQQERNAKLVGHTIAGWTRQIRRFSRRVPDVVKVDNCAYPIDMSCFNPYAVVHLANR